MMMPLCGAPDTVSGSFGIIGAVSGIKGNSLLFENSQSLLEILILSVIFKMFYMCFDCIHSMGNNVFHNLCFVEGFSLPLLDGYCPFGTVPQAGTEAVTEHIAYQPGLAVNYLNCPFGTVGYT